MDFDKVKKLIDNIVRLKKAPQFDINMSSNFYKMYVLDKQGMNEEILTKYDNRQEPVKKGVFDFSYKKKKEEYDAYMTRVEESQNKIKDAKEAMNWLMAEIERNINNGQFHIEKTDSSTLLHRLEIIILYIEENLKIELPPHTKAQVFSLYMKAFKGAVEANKAYSGSGLDRLVYTHDEHGLHGFICKWKLPVSKRDFEIVEAYMNAARESRTAFKSPFKETVPDDTKDAWKERFGVVMNDDYTCEIDTETENSI